MAKAKFDIKQLMSEASKATQEENAERKTVTVPLDMLDASPENLYSMNGIEELAASIEMVGLLQPPLIRKKPNGRYAVIAGHRRRAALKMLVEGGNEEYKTIPCVLVQHDDDVMAELQLLMANSTARVMTDADKVYQAERIKELLTRLKESGYKFGMRMRDVLAQLMNTSYTNAGRYESIIKNLSEDWRRLFTEGRISITTAYELSRREEAEQSAMIDKYKATGIIAFPARKTAQERTEKEQEAQEEPEKTAEQCGKATEEIIAEAEAIRERNKAEKQSGAAEPNMIQQGMPDGIKSAERIEAQHADMPVIIHVVRAIYESLEDGKTVYFEQCGSEKRMAVRLEVVG